MRIQLISHASVIIETSDCKIWTDPWLSGKAFNNSWSLLMKAYWENRFYDEIDFLWISHEHPDHFHIETLKSLSEAFKQRVTVLFQQNNSDKLPNALRAFGFKNIQRLPNRKIIDIRPETKIYNCQIGQMDSALAVMNQGEVLLNVNDCEINAIDCNHFVKDLGKINIVLNQFSIAGYNGDINYTEHLPVLGKRILNSLIENHRDLKADLTIPFASFIYFSSTDNKYVNTFTNTPQAVYEHFEKDGLNCAVLYPGDSLDSTLAYNSTLSLKKFEQLYINDPFVYDDPEPVSINEIENAVIKRHQQLKQKYPAFLLKKLALVSIRIPDLGITVRLSLYEGSLQCLQEPADFDLIIHSQPLFYAFDTPWGLQTLGVSARYLIKSRKEVWKWYRIITSLNNAEVYLKPKYLFTKSNLNFIKSRLGGGWNQLLYQLKRMD